MQANLLKVVPMKWRKPSSAKPEQPEHRCDSTWPACLGVSLLLPVCTGPGSASTQQQQERGTQLLRMRQDYGICLMEVQFDN
jgi:hypothetical protein